MPCLSATSIRLSVNTAISLNVFAQKHTFSLSEINGFNSSDNGTSL